MHLNALYCCPVEGLVGPCRIGGQVNNLELEDTWTLIKERQQQLRGVEKSLDRRVMSRASLLAMVAAHEALDQAGWFDQPNRNFSLADEISCRTGGFFILFV